MIARTRGRRSVRQQGGRRGGAHVQAGARSCRSRPASSATRPRARRRSADFYYGVYHTLVVAPATSNTVAKCVYGISDTLVDQRVRAGRQVPRAGDRVCLRHRAGARDRGAEGHGQGLSAPHRSREYRAPEIVRGDRRSSRRSTELEHGAGAPQARTRSAWLSASSFSPVISRGRGSRRSWPASTTRVRMVDLRCRREGRGADDRGDHLAPSAAPGAWPIASWCRAAAAPISTRLTAEFGVRSSAGRRN